MGSAVRMLSGMSTKFCTWAKAYGAEKLFQVTPSRCLVLGKCERTGLKTASIESERPTSFPDSNHRHPRAYAKDTLHQHAIFGEFCFRELLGSNLYTCLGARVFFGHRGLGPLKSFYQCINVSDHDLILAEGMHRVEWMENWKVGKVLVSDQLSSVLLNWKIWHVVSRQQLRLWIDERLSLETYIVSLDVLFPAMWLQHRICARWFLQHVHCVQAIFHVLPVKLHIQKRKMYAMQAMHMFWKIPPFLAIIANLFWDQWPWAQLRAVRWWWGEVTSCLFCLALHLKNRFRLEWKYL